MFLGPLSQSRVKMHRYVGVVLVSETDGGGQAAIPENVTFFVKCARS